MGPALSIFMKGLMFIAIFPFTIFIVCRMRHSLLGYLWWHSENYDKFRQKRDYEGSEDAMTFRTRKRRFKKRALAISAIATLEVALFLIYKSPWIIHHFGWLFIPEG